ncbi:MAG: patatin-like phospholipase family protein [Proteobacteria bacterium]|nr:patatin-like phospholipase family protein [Pseudomonadota bacterium]
MQRNGALLFKAGPAALEDVRKHGFSVDRIGTIAGASGGAKWLVLSQLDRIIADRILPRLDGPVHLIGSSIGSWRHACYAQSDPLAAIDRFESAYLDQTYSPNPDMQEISDKAREILHYLFGEHGAAQVVSHPVLRSHIMTVRSGFLTSGDSRLQLSFGLMVAATANLITRRALGAFFSRGLFYDARDLPPFFDAKGFPLQQIMLSEENIVDAAAASASVPLVMAGIENIKDAPVGVYRDGGVIDYHLDLPLSEPDRLTLFPHFSERLIPGWFDKKLSWRKPNPQHTDRTILICPSAEFVSRLPFGKIPDRTDFLKMDQDQRMQSWRKTVNACRELADDLADVLDNGRVAARLQPL